ncbi:hypothetical protein HZZ00_37665 (plasmid) [Streptomyces sp. NEAU-sy36]|uniref:hypothetical protein n=1 Tax=unclassified Streptomyces TaxID=2593676 RepID=UPI0015D5F759|nr:MULTISPECIES: hypothetical protein [unclassified Streptomyces]QLJ06719.1 hypothetical protein HZZ00_37665 [Streptomyces sp. NEAU-sy36]
MTCEDTPTRLTWQVELHEPFSGVWICQRYGRATTTAALADIARAVLAGHLAAAPPRPGDTLRAVAYTDTGTRVTVTADELAIGSWEASPAVREALPVYLRDALPAPG